MTHPHKDALAKVRLHIETAIIDMEKGASYDQNKWQYARIELDEALQHLAQIEQGRDAAPVTDDMVLVKKSSMLEPDFESMGRQILDLNKKLEGYRDMALKQARIIQGRQSSCDHIWVKFGGQAEFKLDAEGAEKIHQAWVETARMKEQA